MIKVRVRSDESITFSGVNGSIFDARPHPTGGYYIYWWSGVGYCFEYVHTLMALIVLAESEVNFKNKEVLCNLRWKLLMHSEV